jgi:hypothetical protein
VLQSSYEVRVNKRGQPPLEAGQRSVSLNLRMPAKMYDAVWRRAYEARVSVSEIIRADVRDGAEAEKKKRFVQKIGSARRP